MEYFQLLSTIVIYYFAISCIGDFVIANVVVTSNTAEDIKLYRTRSLYYGSASILFTLLSAICIIKCVFESGQGLDETYRLLSKTMCTCFVVAIIIIASTYGYMNGAKYKEGKKPNEKKSRIILALKAITSLILMVCLILL